MGSSLVCSAAVAALCNADLSRSVIFPMGNKLSGCRPIRLQLRSRGPEQGWKRLSEHAMHRVHNELQKGKRLNELISQLPRLDSRAVDLRAKLCIFCDEQCGQRL